MKNRLEDYDDGRTERLRITPGDRSRRPTRLRRPPGGPTGDTPGLADVARGWVGGHPLAGLGAGLAAGVVVGWFLKRR